MTPTAMTPTRRTAYTLLRITILLSHRAFAIVDTSSCCSPTSTQLPAGERVVNWNACGHSIEYVLENGTKSCIESSDIRQDIQNLTRYLPRKTITDKAQLVCRESLVHVDVQGKIQCVEDTCSRGKLIIGSYQLRLNCTSRGGLFYLVDADPPIFEWVIDKDFGTLFDFNRYVNHTIKTRRPYSYSATECDFQTTPIDSKASELLGYCMESGDPGEVIHVINEEDYPYYDEEGKYYYGRRKK